MEQVDDEQAEVVISLRDQLSSILGHKNMTAFLCDDHLVMDATQEEEIKAAFDFDLPGRRSCWQQLRLKNLEGSPSTFKVIDESGIVLALRADLLNGLARKVAKEQPAVL